MAERGRPHRSPSRYLAPLALAATLAGVYLIVSDSLHASSGSHAGTSTSAPQQGSTATGTATSETAQTTTGGAEAAFYVVRAGDTLSAIALRTHVPVATIERLNPGVAANALRVGQRLRLRR